MGLFAILLRLLVITVWHAIAYQPLTFSREDLLRASRLAVDVFFEEQRSITKGLHLHKLEKLHYSEMERRARLRLVGEQSALFMLDGSEGLKGVVEMYPHELDYALLMDVDPDLFKPLVPTSRGTVILPKIANLAVARAARRFGVGSQLMTQCEQEARRWGNSHVTLFVDDDNIAGREFYRRLGFKELYTDRSCRRYVVSGLFLRHERNPKILLAKNIAEP